MFGFGKGDTSAKFWNVDAGRMYTDSEIAEALMASERASRSFHKRNEESNAGWIDVGDGFSFNPKEASRAEREMLRNNQRVFNEGTLAEYMRGLDILATKSKPAPDPDPKLDPDPTLDVVALSKRWGIDSLADVKYLMGYVHGPKLMLGAVDQNGDAVPPCVFPMSAPCKGSDVFAFEARMAFVGMTAKKLLKQWHDASAKARAHAVDAEGHK